LAKKKSKNKNDKPEQIKVTDKLSQLRWQLLLSFKCLSKFARLLPSE